MLLHKFHVIHGDLKPDKFLLDSNFHPHITDFRLSKFFDPSNPERQSINELGIDGKKASNYQ